MDTITDPWEGLSPRSDLFEKFHYGLLQQSNGDETLESEQGASHDRMLMPPAWLVKPGYASTRVYGKLLGKREGERTLHLDQAEDVAIFVELHKLKLRFFNDYKDLWDRYIRW